MLTTRTERRDGSAGCPACVDELNRWARGGHHLTCRACELDAVAAPSGDRAAFYARLAQLARVTAPVHRTPGAHNSPATT